MGERTAVHMSQTAPQELDKLASPNGEVQDFRASLLRSGLLARPERPIEILPFLNRIGRPDIAERLKPQTPYVYVSMEMHDEDIAGAGGLGMLASDTAKDAERLGIPMVVLTGFYPKEGHQVIENLRPVDYEVHVTPEERGFRKIDNVIIHTLGQDDTNLDIYAKQCGSVTKVAVTEPEFGRVYPKDPEKPDHYIYQEMAVGFGGYAFLKKQGLDPSMEQVLNEAPTVWSALARLDDHLDRVADFDQALKDIKDKIFYTNHTIVSAGEPVISEFQIEKYVIPNIRHDELKSWLRKKVKEANGTVHLSTLAIELSGKRNGVSKIHAKFASQMYSENLGHEVQFDGITNGVAMTRWGVPELMDYYRQSAVLDEFDLPQPNLPEQLANLSEEKLKALKQIGRVQLRDILKARKDQYGNPIDIPPDATIGSWRRRFADYKQPEKMFEDPEEFARILEEENIHIVIAGKTHYADDEMKDKLHQVLQTIDSNPVFKARVHYAQDYDAQLGQALTGVDFTINTPRVLENGKRVSTEACGTSWMKDLLNLSVLISTPDGGVADPEMDAEKEGRLDSYSPSYLRIEGSTEAEQTQSLYRLIRKAAAIVKGQDQDTTWGRFVKGELQDYFPIISGSRMFSDYLRTGYPTVSSAKKEEAA